MRKIKRIILALNKMYRNAVKKDKKLIMMVIVYMFSSCIFDVLLAFFPKILLDMYINAYSIKKMSIFIIVFLISGCFSGMITNVIKQMLFIRLLRANINIWKIPHFLINMILHLMPVLMQKTG